MRRAGRGLQLFTRSIMRNKVEHVCKVDVESDTVFLTDSMSRVKTEPSNGL